jgi:hypothetical protein
MTMIPATPTQILVDLDEAGPTDGEVLIQGLAILTWVALETAEIHDQGGDLREGRRCLFYPSQPCPPRVPPLQRGLRQASSSA